METLRYEKDGGVGLLTINRPAALNALNRFVLQELAGFLERQAVKDALRVLIITGEGQKAFIAGADIKEMEQMETHEMLDFCRLGQRAAHLLEHSPFLTIAAVNGYALGGGLEMALACDFIYASETAKLGLPEVTLGIIPGFGGSQRLARAIGTRHAKELILTGKHIDAAEALSLGLVNRVFKPEALSGACFAVAQQAAKNSSFALSQGKAAINHGQSMGLNEALEYEKSLCGLCFATPERKAAMTAFIEKSTRKAHAG